VRKWREFDDGSRTGGNPFMTTRIFFVIGPAGSGKSTISALIAQRIGAVYIDKDSVATAFTEALLEAAGTAKNERDNNEYYRSVVMDLEYATLLRIAGDNLRLGVSVVLDAPFVTYFPDADYLKRAAIDHDWPPDAEKIVVHVTADGNRVRTRISHRGYERDAWKLDHWDEFWTTTQAAECCWSGARHVFFDNSAEGMSRAALDQAITAPTKATSTLQPPT
jgi:predicted kinase